MIVRAEFQINKTGEKSDHFADVYKDTFSVLISVCREGESDFKMYSFNTYKKGEDYVFMGMSTPFDYDLGLTLDSVPAVDIHVPEHKGKH